MNKPIVNETGYKKIYCPLCQDGAAKPSNKVAAWISPTGTEVCWYTICADCATQFMVLSLAEQRRHSDMIEHNLLTRYPNLKTKLPPGYEPVVEPHANDTVCVPMRLFTRTELQADTESAAAWETNDSIAVDRILMLRHTDLDFWVRELMPRELEIEREDMLIQNMTSPEIIKNVSEFDRQNKGANCRVIKVIDRKGMRFKLSLHLDFVQGQRQATVAMCYGTLTDIVDMSAKMNPGE